MYFVLIGSDFNFKQPTISPPFMINYLPRVQIAKTRQILTKYAPKPKTEADNLKSNSRTHLPIQK